MEKFPKLTFFFISCIIEQMRVLTFPRVCDYANSGEICNGNILLHVILIPWMRYKIVV